MLKFFKASKDLATLSKPLRSLTTIVLPIEPVASNTSIKGSIMNMINKYTNYREIFDTQLESYVAEGMDYQKEGDFERALNNLYQAVIMLKGESIENLTDKQKSLLARAYTSLA